VRIGPAGAGLNGTVELGSYLGAVREHLVRIEPGLRLLVRDTTAGEGRLHAPGEPVSLQWDLTAERVFDEAGAPLLPQNQETSVGERITSHV
jgi:hypothetical protein